MTRSFASLIKKMTLEEKASLMSGANFWNTKAITRLGIPSIMLTDGPHGLRKQGGKSDHLGLNASLPATCFPTAATLANSWDPTLIRKVGAAIGGEAADRHVSVLLGPGLNIVRNPLGGRNFEYYSEDPYLSGKLASASVHGIQSKGVAASPKHYAVNSQESLRMSINEVVDERALREIYLEGFRRVVEEARPGVIMTAYNQVNGQFANEHPHLLQDILYGEWGFDGVAVTDWGGNNDRVAGLIAGNQLEMPSSSGITDKEIVEAVRSGRLSERLLDQRVDELLRLVMTTSEAIKHAVPVDLTAHHRQAIEAAEQSMVLLKNDRQLLPLHAGTKIAVIGDFAKKPRYQGAGSSLVSPTRLDGALEALTETELEIVGYEPGYKRFGGRSDKLARRAVRLARDADVVLLFLGLDESVEAEGLDRNDMRLPDAQRDLVDRLTAMHDNVVVVLAGGAPVELPFITEVPVVLHSFLGGQGGGDAVARIITGEVNPSGKLAVTYPYDYTDVPSAGYYPGKETTAEHRESIYVGYRYYDTATIPVRYPFGYGLSYTTFTYGKLSVNRQKVTFTITNSGSLPGAEVAQVYVAAPSSSAVYRATRELKGFIKVFLQPGESQEVSIDFDDKTFAFYDPRTHQWTIETGTYGIQVGASLTDIRLTKSLKVSGASVVPMNKDALAHYFSGQVQKVPRKEYETLLGSPLPPEKWRRSGAVHMTSSIAHIRHLSLRGRLAYGALRGVRALLMATGHPLTANNVLFVINLPLYKIARMSGGRVTSRQVQRFFGAVE